MLKDIGGKLFDFIYIDVPKNRERQDWFYSLLVEHPLSFQFAFVEKKGTATRYFH